MFNQSDVMRLLNFPYYFSIIFHFFVTITEMNLKKMTRRMMGMIGVVVVMMGIVLGVEGGGNVPEGDCIVKLWPQPSEQTNGSAGYLSIIPSSFSIRFSPPLSSPSLSSLLSRITSRYLSLLSLPSSPSSPSSHRPYSSSSSSSSSTRKEGWKGRMDSMELKELKGRVDSMELKELVIEVNETQIEENRKEEWPNESYSLSVPFSSSASLVVYSIPSLVWGLETFSQLILFNNFSLLSRSLLFLYYSLSLFPPPSIILPSIIPLLLFIHIILVIIIFTMINK